MSNEDILGNMSEEELNAILESDDPILIEKMLNEFAEGTPSNDSKSKTDEEGGQKTDEPAEKITEVESAASSAEAAPSDVTGAYIQSKNGDNKIPYAVLENARQERNQLKQQLEQANSKLTAFENKNQKVSSYLEKNGIDLSVLERGETLDDEQIAALEELDPAIAKLARLTMGIQEQQKALAEQMASARETQVSPLEFAIRENKDLSTWRTSDPDRWDTAKQYDDLLMQDPAFKNSSLEERFAEAVKRTKLLFNDPVDQPVHQITKPQKTIPRESAAEIAAKKVAEATQKSVPRSLTDIGATPSTERSMAETLGDLSDDSLVEKMAGMTPAQIDKLLASL